jgi:hypothetical protein
MAIRKGIAREVLRALLAEDGSGAPDEHAARFLVDSVFDADSDGRPEVRLRMRQPLAPIGAPVRAFFPDLARPLGAELVFTDHVEVANAVGAIAGEVALMEQVEIAAVSDGALQLQSRLETRKFFRLADALDHAERLIRDALREKAELNGIPFADPEFHARESAPQTRDGVVFLGVTLTGRVRA